MSAFVTFSELLDQHLLSNFPERIYHYTSAEALIGIVSSKEIWATNTLFLNDSKEIVQAIEQTRSVIEHHFEHGQFRHDELHLLERLKNNIGSAAARFYVASFTELNDSLSQWRAYCPSTGGYNVGLASQHLSRRSILQNFRLVKCIYDISLQRNIINQITLRFLNEYNLKFSKNEATEDFIKDLTWQFTQHISKIGVIMKHPSFEEEKEWRLISGAIDERNNLNIGFRSNHKGLIPFYKFKLTDTASTSDEINKLLIQVFVGPSVDIFTRNMSLQFMLSRYLDGHTFSFGISQIPYKTW